MAQTNPQIDQIIKRLDTLEKQIRTLTTLSYRAEVTGGVATYTFTNLPSANIAGKVAFCSDCRRSDQGAGAGTGVLVVVALLAGVLTWTRVDDPTQAAAT